MTNNKQTKASRVVMTYGTDKGRLYRFYDTLGVAVVYTLQPGKPFEYAGILSKVEALNQINADLKHDLNIVTLNPPLIICECGHIHNSPKCRYCGRPHSRY